MTAARSTYRAWLGKAESDLLTIENNVAAERVPWDAVCFHAQQAAEKTLKAFLVLHGAIPARTHDLTALLAECLRFDASLAGLQAECDTLSTYAVAARYPDDVLSIDERIGRDTISAMYRVRASLLTHFPQEDS